MTFCAEEVNEFDVIICCFYFFYFFIVNQSRSDYPRSFSLFASISSCLVSLARLSLFPLFSHIFVLPIQFTTMNAGELLANSLSPGIVVLLSLSAPRRASDPRLNSQIRLRVKMPPKNSSRHPRRITCVASNPLSYHTFLTYLAMIFVRVAWVHAHARL